MYVDWIEDQQLDRSKVTAATAKYFTKENGTIEKLSICCYKQILVIRNGAHGKLGYVDASKKMVVVQILPIMKDEGSTFKGQEYLGLYPFIDYAPIENTQKYQFG